MSFQNSEENPIEFFILEVALLMAIREGIQHRIAHVRILETLSEWIFLYESGLSPKAAFNKFRSSNV
jgi:hypothetical protein